MIGGKLLNSAAYLYLYLYMSPISISVPVFLKKVMYWASFVGLSGNLLSGDKIAKKL